MHFLHVFKPINFSLNAAVVVICQFSKWPFDLAVNSESAKIKEFVSPVTGDADILICPDLVSGNLMSKSIIQFGKATMTGLIYGAKVPVVLTSRSASIEEKYLSLVLAAMVS